MTIKKIYGVTELARDFGPFSFGKMLESYRLSSEASQKDFAKMLGISPASLCDLEKGRRIPTPDRAVKIARKLKEPPAFWVRLALQDQLDQAGIKLKVSVA
jgi:transcriptional regulator with XRE-family HTH domain